MIYIIRHGQTAKNKANLLQGRSDIPLNEEGRRQAEEAAARFKENGISFDLCYTSPLVRAVETAEIIARGIPAERDARLIEMDYGPYEGMDLMNPAPEIMEFFSDFAHNPAPCGMEQLSSVIARAGEFMEDIRHLTEDRTILISTHAIAMKGVLEYLTPESKGGYWSKYIGNCGVYAIPVSGGGYDIPYEI